MVKKTVQRDIVTPKSLCEVLKLILKYLEGGDTGTGHIAEVSVLVLDMRNMQKLEGDLY